MVEAVIDILRIGLPGGFLGSIVTYFVSRRTRDNDMLAKLQASINLLADENRKILAENVQLRRENAGLKAAQEELIVEVSHLSKEIERLRKIINRQINETNIQRGNSPHGNGCRRGDRDELLSSQKESAGYGERGDGDTLLRLNPRRDGREERGEERGKSPHGEGADTCPGGGGECLAGGESDEPP